MSITIGRQLQSSFEPSQSAIDNLNRQSSTLTRQPTIAQSPIGNRQSAMDYVPVIGLEIHTQLQTSS